ncbi:MAG: lipopolysaccharide kinase InaA family protein [Propionivibrio sp.]
MRQQARASGFVVSLVRNQVCVTRKRGMSSWYLNPEYCAGDVAACFRDLDAVFALEGEVVSRDPLCRVLRVSIQGRCYYVKLYVGNGKSLVRQWFGLRGLLAPQRVVREARNFLFFREQGVPTATVVAYGLERSFGRFVRGALVTEEVPNTRDLAKTVREHPEYLKDKPWFDAVSKQVAETTRRLHDAGFAHNDLKWRNLLVNDEQPPRIYLIDCPFGNHWWHVFLQYRIVKDLASLDREAKKNLSRTQRLRFYLAYAQSTRLDTDDKRRIRRIAGFYDGRRLRHRFRR